MTVDDGGRAAPAEIRTERLILRPWNEDDAAPLYALARDPAVGPAAGWPPHTGVENSRAVIRAVLARPGTYAMTLTENRELAGCVSVLLPGSGNLPLAPGEGEIGYWLGAPYQGRGLMTEAVGAMVRMAFTVLRVSRLWGAYFDGNDRSRRVLERCGFAFVRTERDVPWPLTGEVRTRHVHCRPRDAGVPRPGENPS